MAFLITLAFEFEPWGYRFTQFLMPFRGMNYRICNPFFAKLFAVSKPQLRLTYDTASEIFRKMIKKLGEKLKSDPVLGPIFLQPLKPQSVVQMEHPAMIMRVKFMTRPGKQWGIRLIVFVRVRDLFEEHGIKFAIR